MAGAPTSASIRILGWDYLIKSFKSLSCTAEWHEFPPDMEFWEQLLPLQVSGFLFFPTTLSIWERPGTWVTDEPFSNILSPAWVHFPRMKIKMDTYSALGILLGWCCAKLWDIFRGWRDEYKDNAEISENYIWEFCLQAVGFWVFLVSYSVIRATPSHTFLLIALLEDILLLSVESAWISHATKDCQCKDVPSWSRS